MSGFLGEASSVSRDLRTYARSTQFRLIIGFLTLVFVIGEGLILLLYGKEAALLGLLCLLGALLPAGGVIFFLWGAERFLQDQ